MPVAGIIAEYDPLHAGHLYQISRVRELLGEDTAVICAMSGNFVQRGEFAVVRKHTRAEAAVRSGADLVLELPLMWAVSSAERFADGGVEVLEKTGLVTHLVFGSECGEMAPLWRISAALCSADFSPLLQAEIAKGISFAAARQKAVEKLLGEKNARLLETPNNILGIEYCKSLLRRHSNLVPLTVRRKGPGHDGGTEGGLSSASAIRDLLADGKREAALTLMVPAMRELFIQEEQAGRAPVSALNCQRAVLAKLRTMTAEDFLNLDSGNEGLGNRFYTASRNASTLRGFFDEVKTKRYASSRVRRMTLWAYLGIMPEDFPRKIPYLRVLAANATGRSLLARMQKCAAVPILTKPADVRILNDEARRTFALEARSTDLYTLAYPNLDAARGSAEWRISPAILSIP